MRRVRPLEQVPDLEILDEIGRGTQSTVFKALRGGCLYALKIQHRGSAAATRRFRMEAAALARLKAPGLPKVLALGETGDGRAYAVMEYIEGETMAERLKEGPLTERKAVGLVLTVAAALDALHRIGLVHRDVKPSNILIDQGGMPKLIDLGLVTEAAASQPRVVVGTFEYCAPEQSGLLQLPVDGRADLYSLGVVLFRALTGRLPFESRDPAELLHQHAVAPPPDPRELNPELTPALSLIALKLLAKDPEDRYLTAASLCHDLVRLASLNRQSLSGSGPRLGRAGAVNPMGRHPRVVARAAELELLERCWQLVVTGSGNLVEIDGEIGVGKTALVESTLSRRSREGTVVLRAGCSAVGASPFAPLVGALTLFVRELQATPDYATTSQHVKLQEIIASSAPLLKRLSPALGELLRKAPDVAPPRISREQYYSAVADLIAGVAVAYGGAVLHVDDCQWLDDASAGVLRQLVGRLPELPLLMIFSRQGGAERGAGGGLTQRADPHLTSRLQLPPLDEAGVQKLVASFLGDDIRQVELSRQLHARTHGVPLAILEYLTAMVEAGLLYPSWGTWVVRPEAMHRLELPASVIELVSARVRELAPAALEVMTAAAILGLRFRVAQLQRICGAPESVVLDALAEAHGLRLVEPAAAGSYTFVHERVHGTLLSQVEPVRARQLHQRAAEDLQLEDNDDPRHTFEIARHYRNGLSSNDPTGAFHAIEKAAGLASRTFAHEDALAHFESAAEIAGEHDLEVDAGFLTGLGEVCTQLGHTERALAALDAAIDLESDPGELAFIHSVRAELLIAEAKGEEARQAVASALAQLGVRLPSSRVTLALSVVFHWARCLLGERRVLQPASDDEGSLKRKRALYRSLGMASYLEFWAGDTTATFHRFLRMVLAAHAIGPSYQLALTYAAWGFICAEVGLRRRSERYLRKARRIADDLGDPLAAGLVLGFTSHTLCINGDLLGSEAAARQCLVEYAKWVPRLQLLNVFANLNWNHTLRGRVGLGWEWFRRTAARSGIDLTDDVGQNTHSVAALFLVRMGRFGEAKRHLRRCERGETAPTMRFHQLGNVGFQALFMLESEEVGEEFDRLLEEPLRTIRGLGRVQHWMKGLFCARMYGEVLRCRRERLRGGTPDLARLKEAWKEFDRLATRPVFVAHSLIGRAALEWLRDRPQIAKETLAKAEEQGERLDAPWILIEVAEMRRDMALEARRPDLAAAHGRFAWQLAVDAGWTRRAVALAGELRDPWQGLEPGRSGASTPLQLIPEKLEVAGSSSRDIQSALWQRKLDALLEVSLESASRHDFAGLARSALAAVLRVFNAERALLFLVAPNTGELSLSVGRDDDGRELVRVETYSNTVVQQVLTSRQPIILSSSNDGPLLGSESVVAHDLRSVVAVPLEIRERMIGVLYLDSKISRGIFSRDDLDILRAVGSHLAVVLEHVRTAELAVETEGERQKYVLLEWLHAMTSALLSTTDPQEILVLALGGLEETVQADAALGVLLTEGQLQLLHKTGPIEGHDDAPEELRHLAIAAGRLCSELEDCPGVWKGNLDSTGRFCRREEGSLAVLAAPLVVNESLAGALILGTTSKRGFHQNDENLARVFANPAAMALEKASLFGEVQRLATTDELTGLRNRRQLFTLGEREVERSRRYGYPLSAMMIDVDHFKVINDRHGHAVGDEVLALLGQILIDGVRDCDIASRYGGEEFTVLMTDTSPEAATEVGERLRARVASTPLETSAGALSVTVSVGIASVERDEDLRGLLDQADNALYAAKQAGRNRVLTPAAEAPAR